MYLGAQFDASTTNFTYMIPAPQSLSKSTKPVELTLSFLSPITPTSTLRQSIPASYMTVHVKGSFNINLYVDLNGQWVSGNRGSQITWELAHQELGKSDKGLKTWQIRRETELLLSEERDQAEWGTLHFTGPSVSPTFGSKQNPLLTENRTYAMRREPLASYGHVLLEQVPCRTRLTKIFVVSWRMSQYLHSQSRSNSTRQLLTHPRPTLSCSALR